tara:strand:+ start:97 stop:339 length:243 start_codon:yes stop_codon:yes gene_type:complete
MKQCHELTELEFTEYDTLDTLKKELLRKISLAQGVIDAYKGTSKVTLVIEYSAIIHAYKEVLIYIDSKLWSICAEESDYD